MSKIFGGARVRPEMQTRALREATARCTAELYAETEIAAEACADDPTMGTVWARLDAVIAANARLASQIYLWRRTCGNEAWEPYACSSLTLSTTPRDRLDERSFFWDKIDWYGAAHRFTSATNHLRGVDDVVGEGNARRAGYRLGAGLLDLSGAATWLGWPQLALSVSEIATCALYAATTETESETGR